MRQLILYYEISVEYLLSYCNFQSKEPVLRTLGEMSSTSANEIAIKKYTYLGNLIK